MLRGCQIQLHRVGMSAESVCEGILCDGQYKVCGCVSGAKSTKWTLTIVISADKLKQYDEFTITSNYVTELFVTAAARSIKETQLDMFALEDRADEVVATINRNGGFTICLWSKAATTDNEMHKPLRHHLFMLSPTSFEGDLENLKYNGEPVRQLGNGNNDRQAGNGGNNDSQAGNGGNNEITNGGNNQATNARNNQAASDGNQPGRSAKNNVGNASRAGQNYPAAHVPFAGSVRNSLSLS
ncbi:hypothetical protein Pmar_PMAR003927 [Perkinsus marinus ATCC 50983]|uniref:Uncharacterized protein n=1 Tax=Perkinsus marinus (strain ATCC 50983 / TXsc) TaxID=423536 RepID=C5L847_PERM5|nr:hypothetical protein Pmar_PMAR003927 [Perkinsus marinus ATCC 50983]EER07073.1 hypothetical protein Pmar_PMAR003927 [Perkinsus marinus ATCC 50983]|eukprot:XP_002775257.1 hypothetical protein Pmar_PMAR003927 [Perkinsus marinus ATCC 50983]